MTLSYRPEIDGLRALAVLAIILFHAGFHTFDGGYVGVDIFFVISGYLITSIIVSERDSGSFSLLQFYERRVRRILPALFVVIAACIILSLIFLLPHDMKQFARSVVATATFSSNVFFWRESGYFDTSSDLKPLVHTWSLAIEEQFYLLFPMLLLLCARFAAKWTAIALAVIAVASLALAQWESKHAPTANFYLLPTRAWELMLGGLLALYLHGKPPGSALPGRHARILNEIAAAAGFLLIAYAVFAFGPETPFPSLYALIPTVGAVLLILCATPQTAVGRLLAVPALVTIGLLSYSAYLWHQPIFVFAREEVGGEPSRPVMALLIVVTLVLAYLSTRWIEQPLRDRRRISRKAIFAGAAIGSLVLATVGVAGSLSGGFRGRLPPNIAWESLGDKVAAKGFPCERRPVPNDESIRACYFGAKNFTRTIAVYGDSHAQALLDQLNAAFGNAGIRAVWVDPAKCQVIPGVFRLSGRPPAPEQCKQSFASLLRFIKDHADGVIIAGRWTFRLYPIPGEIEALSFDNGEGGVERESPRRYAVFDADNKPSFAKRDKTAALVNLIASMLSLRMKVWLVYPVPEIGWNIARLNWDYYYQNRSILPTLSVSYDGYKKRNRLVTDAFDGITDPNLIRIRPERLFCDTYLSGRCVAQFNGVPYYYDDDHLSDAGAKLVVAEIMKTIGK